MMPGDDRAAWFIQNACPDHTVRGRPAHTTAIHTARRMLERDPGIAGAGLFSAVVCGDVAAVERALAADPDAATRRDGPKQWEPLLYLAFTRLPFARTNDNALAIARLLLDRGANPRAFFMAGDSRYTPLVGAIGEGEEDRPAHPCRDELARLLLERGAEPYDLQVVYNIHFHGRVLWFLELMHEFSVQAGRSADWRDPAWSMLDMGGYGSGARWHLQIAVDRNDLRLAEWCLEHGASPDATPARDPRFSKRTLYEDAVRDGSAELAALLARHGARTELSPPTDEDAFTAACFHRDSTAARMLVAAHPEFLRTTRTLFLAARRDRADVVAFLLDLGVSADVHDARGERALHVAAYHGAARVVRLLIERGAEVDAHEHTYDAPPLGWAIHADRAETIDLLSEVSGDVFELTFAGKVDRLRRVLADAPERARAVNDEGDTPLMWLPPASEPEALEIARLLMRHGANPAARNKKGSTAADRARRTGLEQVAALLADGAGAGV